MVNFELKKYNNLVELKYYAVTYTHLFSFIQYKNDYRVDHRRTCASKRSTHCPTITALFLLFHALCVLYTHEQ